MQYEELVALQHRINTLQFIGTERMLFQDRIPRCPVKIRSKEGKAYKHLVVEAEIQLSFYTLFTLRQLTTIA
jgi:hypothetical protein